MQRQIDQLCHLVNDLLDLTRITNNKIELKKERVDLNQLALSTLEDHKMFFEEKEIRLESEINEDAMCSDSDPVRIKQVIENLLYNAMKFTNAGGRVKLSIVQENNDAVIKVEDNGIGINPEFLPDLFEPFKQADKSLDRRNSGLGLGLSIIKGIAELHGGSVSAASDGLGKGSKFIIKLPLSDDTLKKNVVE
jgi:signal transduction histidine kinase